MFSQEPPKDRGQNLDFSPVRLLLNFWSQHSERIHGQLFSVWSDLSRQPRETNTNRELPVSWSMRVGGYETVWSVPGWQWGQCPGYLCQAQ